MSSLGGKRIKDTYRGLVAFNADNIPLGTTVQRMGDGDGNDSVLGLSTTQMEIFSQEGIYRMPTSAGVPGQVLATDGSDGTLYWINNTVNWTNINQNLIPDLDDTRTIGLPARKWQSLYLGEAGIDILDSTITSESNNLVLSSDGGTIILKSDLHLPTGRIVQIGSSVPNFVDFSPEFAFLSAAELIADGDTALSALYVGEGGITIVTNINNQPDIWLKDNGVITTEGNIYFSIDNNDDQTERFYLWGHNATSADTIVANELMRLDENGDLTVLGTIRASAFSGIVSTSGTTDVSAVSQLTNDLGYITQTDADIRFLNSDGSDYVTGSIKVNSVLSNPNMQRAAFYVASNDTYGLASVDDAGVFVSFDYIVGRGGSVAGSATAHQFRVDNEMVARIVDGNSSTTLGAEIITRNKGDARYSLSSSGLKFKEDPVSAQPVDLLQLHRKKWTWGNEMDEEDPRYGLESSGLIADEVASILPEAVKYDDQNRPQGLEPLVLIGALLDEVKKLKQEIEDLKNAGLE